MTNFRGHFKDIAFFAKHWLVKDLSGGVNGVARHYTTCNAMRPDLYQALLNACKPAGDPDQQEVSDSLLATSS